VQVEVGRRAGFPVESVAPRLIRLLGSLAHLALPRAVALKVQRASRIATNTDHIHPRVARSERGKRRKGQCQRPHQIIGPSRVEKRGVQMQWAEVGRKSGLPVKVVDRLANRHWDICLILLKNTQLRRIERRKGNEQRCQRRAAKLGGEWRTCAMRNEEPRPVRISLLITH
jgi:hypothetical protein